MGKDELPDLTEFAKIKRLNTKPMGKRELADRARRAEKSLRRGNATLKRVLDKLKGMDEE